MTRIVVLDTETCGLDAGVVEIAGVRVQDGVINPEAWLTSFIDPEGVPMQLEALATHHITADLYASAPTLSQHLDSEYGSVLYRETDYVAAHNAPFDLSMMPQDDPIRSLPWIDTLQCAVHLFPDSPAYGNQVLRYHLDLDVSDMPSEAGGLVHRALFDAWCTARLLERELALVDNEPEELVRLTRTPALLVNCTFGKHKGKTYEYIARHDRGWLGWLARSDRDNMNEKFTARHWLD